MEMSLGIKNNNRVMIGRHRLGGLEEQECKRSIGVHSRRCSEHWGVYQRVELDCFCVLPLPPNEFTSMIIIEGACLLPLAPNVVAKGGKTSVSRDCLELR